MACASEQTLNVSPMLTSGQCFPPTKLRSNEIKTTLQLLAQNGVQRVFTSAIRSREQSFFRNIGFELHEELLLLSHDLSAQIPAPTRPTRRAQRSDWPHILDIDASAFYASSGNLTRYL